MRCCSRTVHSLVVLLSMFPFVKLIYIAPSGLELPRSIMSELEESGAEGLEQVRCLILVVYA